MKKYLGYLASFILGGVIFGYVTFHYYGNFIGKFMAHNLYVSEAVAGKQSIRIIENINSGEMKKAIYELEINIVNSKTTLGECEHCFEREKESLKEISEYEFTEYHPTISYQSALRQQVGSAGRA